MVTRTVLVACVLLGTVVRVEAQAFDLEDSLPPVLRPWVPWVLDAHPDRRCPWTGEQRTCVWPSGVDLAVDAQGGRFEQRVFLDREGDVELPGEPGLWPLEVRVDGTEAPVLGEDIPRVHLSAGMHRIDGRFRWPEGPETLRVGEEMARVTLEVNGEPRPVVRREDARVWIQPQRTAAEAARLDVRVFRRLRDGAPFFVETRVQMSVSGAPREVNLGRALLAGTRATSLSADLPARVDREGQLIVQAWAGEHEVTLGAHAAAAPAVLSASAVSEPDAIPWPEYEVWLWQAEDALREVRLEGAPRVDPVRAGVPAQWQVLPAYRVRRGGQLTVKTVRRGEPEAAPNWLALTREMWLDLDGRGYTVQDGIRGQLHRDWRLDLTAGDLREGRVVLGSEDQVITRMDKSNAGVEVRRSEVDLTAEWRLRRQGPEPAVGWSEDMRSVEASLNLPPGWSLFAAQGVDKAPGAWTSSWTLVDFFVALLLAAAFGRTIGWPWGAAALVAMVVWHGEAGAPRWIWLALLGAIALLGVLPPGRARNATWGGLVGLGLMLLWIAIPFAVDQVRLAVYPQVADSDALGGPSGAGFRRAVGERLEEKPIAVALQMERMESQGSERPASAPPTPSDAMEEAAEPEEDGGGRRAGREAAGPESREHSAWKKALTEGAAGEEMPHTGPGVPQWRWNRWALAWSGPVSRGHTMRLWLVPPWANGLLNFLRVFLMAALALGLWRALRETIPRIGRGTGAAAASLLLAVTAASASPVSAQAFPDEGMLQQLETRLLRPESCRPRCVAASLLTVRIEEEVTLRATVHAGALSSFPLPGPLETWAPSSVLVDGRPAQALVRDAQGFMRVRLDPGSHEVVARGLQPEDGAMTLSFPVKPARVEVEAADWQVQGLREDGQVDASLQLSRSLGTIDAQKSVVDPWFEVERAVGIGVQMRVETTVRRLTPMGRPYVLRVPLIEGEQVAEAGRLIEDSHVVLSFGPDDEAVRWSSTLPMVERLTLRAPKGEVRWSELWRLTCTALWRCAHSGVAPVERIEQGAWQPSFRPWPGEELQLTFTKPQPVDGSSVTVDSVVYEVTPGRRAIDARLEVFLRTSGGTAQRWSLPKGARVESVELDGEVTPIDRASEKLSLTVPPGGHTVRVRWQQEEGLAVRQRMPKIDLGVPATNVSMRMSLPEGRWLLWAGGPPWGPAVLFWGYLLVIAMAAALLALLPGSPLKFWQWLLLGVGLTQIHVLAVLAIVGWFFVLEWRGRARQASAEWHNAQQVGIGLWSVVALGCLVAAIYAGLLVQPDMQVAGGGSDEGLLAWYVDRTQSALPEAYAFSVPLWVWQAAMLIWSLWIAWSLVEWMPWAWGHYTRHGLWRRAAATTSAKAKDAKEADASEPQS